MAVIENTKSPQFGFQNNSLYDSNLILDAGQTITSSAAGTVAYIDLGSDAQSASMVQLNLVTTAMDIASGNETYTISVQSCNSTDFSSTTVFTQFSIPLTAAAADTAGVYNAAFRPNGRYVRIYYALGGTTPSLTISKALLSPVK